MVVSQQFISDFEAQVARAEGRPARFETTGFFQKASSLAPVYRQLTAALNGDLNWDAVKPTVAAIPLEKQQKYSAALKYLQKTLEGHGSKMFESLRQYATKVSKSQQRYTIPMLGADDTVTAAERSFASGGLCFNLAMLWLREQFIQTPQSLYPRIATGNVMGSPTAYAVTKQAASMTTFKSEWKSVAAGSGLKMAEKTFTWSLSFNACEDHFRNYPDVDALLISFFNGWHAVALFREPSGSILFYDANAGSYRVAATGLRAFLRQYNDVCLPLKWPAAPAHPAYSDPATRIFNRVYQVARL